MRTRLRSNALMIAAAIAAVTADPVSALTPTFQNTGFAGGAISLSGMFDDNAVSHACTNLALASTGGAVPLLPGATPSCAPCGDAACGLAFPIVFATSGQVVTESGVPLPATIGLLAGGRAALGARRRRRAGA